MYPASASNNEPSFISCRVNFQGEYLYIIFLMNEWINNLPCGQLWHWQWSLSESPIRWKTWTWCDVTAGATVKQKKFIVFFFFKFPKFIFVSKWNNRNLHSILSRIRLLNIKAISTSQGRCTHSNDDALVEIINNDSLRTSVIVIT